jgi:acyl-CoA thioesterase FadM
MGTEPDFRFVTASLHVDYLRPTPIDAPMELRGKVEEIKGRKVVVSVTLKSKGEICAKGKVVAVQLPDKLRNSRR